MWLVLIVGAGEIDGQEIKAGEAWLVDAPVPLTLGQGMDMVVVAYTRSCVIEGLWTAG